MMVYIWLLLGFVLLIKGADWFVDGSSSVAKILRVPSIIIGLTVVAFGTSAPELAVSVAAALTGNNDISIGNVIGSNLFNMLVVTGACTLAMPMIIDKKIIKNDFPFSIIVSAVLFVMIVFDKKISRPDGIILLMIFGWFIFKTVRDALSTRVEATEAAYKISPVKSVLAIIIGLTGVVIGGDVVVDSASRIASDFGLSQTLIGLTIVAMGTSLPEFVTSVIASRKGENGLALGNVIGSNIFNILLVLGASSVLKPMAISALSVFDLMVLLISSILVIAFAKIDYKLSAKEGIVMLLFYGIYMVYIILR